jgi:hypothetical protein
VAGRGTVTVVADGRAFPARVRLDTAREVEYYRHGAILSYVLRRLLAQGERGAPLPAAARVGRSAPR